MIRFKSSTIYLWFIAKKKLHCEPNLISVAWSCGNQVHENMISRAYIRAWFEWVHAISIKIWVIFLFHCGIILWKLENNFFIEYWAVEIQHFDNRFQLFWTSKQSKYHRKIVRSFSVSLLSFNFTVSTRRIVRDSAVTMCVFSACIQTAFLKLHRPVMSAVASISKEKPLRS